MAMDSVTGEIIDPANGREDLKNRKLRSLGNFSADPVRVLRLVRFSLISGFEITPKTYEEAKSCTDFSSISEDRLRGELSKLIDSCRDMFQFAELVTSETWHWLFSQILTKKFTFKLSKKA